MATKELQAVQRAGPSCTCYVEYLRQAWQATPEFILPNLWPPNSPDLTQLTRKYRGVFRSGCIKSVYQKSMSWNSIWLR